MWLFPVIIVLAGILVYRRNLKHYFLHHWLNRDSLVPVLSKTHEVISLRHKSRPVCHVTTWKSKGSLRVTGHTDSTAAAIEIGYYAGYYYGVDISPALMGYTYFTVSLDGQTRFDRVEANMSLLSYLKSQDFSSPPLLSSPFQLDTAESVETDSNHQD
jgi:hypothetical protein